jgi:transposase
MDNLDELEKHGYAYIVGARIKNMKKELTGKILSRTHYHEIQATGINRKKKADRILLAHFWYQKDRGRRLIVSHSEKRGKKDAHDRQKAIDKLMKTKDLKKLTGNYGYRKYIKITGEITATVDQDKIKEASKWDGLHGVITNATKITDIEILKHYRSLWQIEESFRVTKHDLRIRPIYHWKPERVKAHIAIAFITYTLVRHMEYRVRLQYRKLSPEVIRNELLHVQASMLRDQKTNKRYVLPSSMSNQAQKIYKVMGLTRSITPYAI